MPRLRALADAGGEAPDGGRCDLPSVTYPCHATMLTGRLTRHHGVRTNRAAAPHPGVVPGWAGEPGVTTPTLLDRCRDAGLRSAAILGDFKLYGILHAETADLVWPTQGVVPPSTPVCAHGYPTNAAVRPHLLAAIDDPTLAFVFGHLNEPDTCGHRLGPDHPDTIASYTATDQLIGEVIDRLANDWTRTVLIVLSDHGMEPAPHGPSINLPAHAGFRDHVADHIDEGGTALVRLKPGSDPTAAGVALVAIPGVVRWEAIGPEMLLLEAAPGEIFATGPSKSLRGVHGGSGTTRTTAVVGGGHPAVAIIAAAMQPQPPHLADWAPTIAPLLDLPPTATDGRNLALG